MVARFLLIATCLGCACSRGTSAAENQAFLAKASGPWACETAKPIEGRPNLPMPDRPKPEKGAVHMDPLFRTCLQRATDHVKEKINNFSRNDYSRRQAFNSDSTLFFTNTQDGGWVLYDANTLAKLKVLNGLSGDAEPQWHATDPNTLYYGFRNGGMQIMALDVRENKSRVVADLKGKLPWPTAARAWTKSEGSPSSDGRYWGFQVETDNFDILGFAVWDMVENKLIGSVARTVRPDHVSMSPSGRWLVSSGEDGIIAWSRDLSLKRLLSKTGEHSDLAIGENGHDYLVSIDYQHHGFIYMLDIDTNVRTDLIRTYESGSASAFHFSGKGFRKPGWVVLSAYTGTGPERWYMGKVFAMELRENPRVYPLAVHHSAVNGKYFAEPQACVNRDFTRVLFNSNWGAAGSEDIDAYLIRLPKDAIP